MVGQTEFAHTRSIALHTVIADKAFHSTAAVFPRRIRHRGDPLSHQGDSFLVDEPLAELGHHDAGVG